MTVIDGLVEVLKVSLLLWVVAVLVDVANRHLDRRADRKRFMQDQGRIMDYFQLQRKRERAKQPTLTNPFKKDHCGAKWSKKSFRFFDEEEEFKEKLELFEKKRGIHREYQKELEKSAANDFLCKQDREFQEVRDLMYHPSAQRPRPSNTSVHTHLDVKLNPEIDDTERHLPTIRVTTPQTNYHQPVSNFHYQQRQPNLQAQNVQVSQPTNYELTNQSSMPLPSGWNYYQPYFADNIPAANYWNCERMMQYNHFFSPIEQLYQQWMANAPTDQPLSGLYAAISVQPNQFATNPAQRQIDYYPCAPMNSPYTQQTSGSLLFPTTSTVAPPSMETYQNQFKAHSQLFKPSPNSIFSEPVFKPLERMQPPQQIQVPKEPPKPQLHLQTPISRPSSSSNPPPTKSPTTSTVNGLLPIFQVIHKRPRNDEQVKREHQAMIVDEPVVMQPTEPLSPQYPITKSPQYPPKKCKASDLEDSPSSSFELEPGEIPNPGISQRQTKQTPAHMPRVNAPVATNAPLVFKEYENLKLGNIFDKKLPTISAESTAQNKPVLNYNPLCPGIVSQNTEHVYLDLSEGSGQPASSQSSEKPNAPQPSATSMFKNEVRASEYSHNSRQGLETIIEEEKQDNPKQSARSSSIFGSGSQRPLPSNQAPSSGYTIVNFDQQRTEWQKANTDRIVAIISTLKKSSNEEIKRPMAKKSGKLPELDEKVYPGLHAFQQRTAAREEQQGEGSDESDEQQQDAMYDPTKTRRRRPARNSRR